MGIDTVQLQLGVAGTLSAAHDIASSSGPSFVLYTSDGVDIPDTAAGMCLAFANP